MEASLPPRSSWPITLAPTSPFGNTAVPGGTPTAIGTGSANTDKIITQNGAASTYAAGLARAYTDGVYHDWYLPSKEELNQLYLNRVAIGGFDTTTYWWYWSSSEPVADVRFPYA